MKYSAFLAAAMLCIWGSEHMAYGEERLPECLYGFALGAERTPVKPCGGDNKRIGSDQTVMSVMRLFNIPREVVTFQECAGGRWLAMPHPEKAEHFIVQYPANVNANYLAPISHELGHVLQMREAGGLKALNDKLGPRRIELGADFLAGLAFNELIKNISEHDFETNLQLVGSYLAIAKSHGTPENRTIAFRRGSNRKEPYRELSITQSLAYWYANDYPRLKE